MAMGTGGLILVALAIAVGLAGILVPTAAGHATDLGGDRGVGVRRTHHRVMGWFSGWPLPSWVPVSW